MTTEVYYDPYDFDIDTDPYPVWKRMRDEAPLCYNEKYDFFALSRYDDAECCFLDWPSYSSAKGSVLEIIKADVHLPPGMWRPQAGELGQALELTVVSSRPGRATA